MSKKGTIISRRRPLQIKVEYVVLPEEENNERIRKLAQQILRVVENAAKKRKPCSIRADASKSAEGVFGDSFEKRLGI